MNFRDFNVDGVLLDFPVLLKVSRECREREREKSETSFYFGSHVHFWKMLFSIVATDEQLALHMFTSLSKEIVYKVNAEQGYTRSKFNVLYGYLSLNTIKGSHYFKPPLRSLGLP